MVHSTPLCTPTAQSHAIPAVSYRHLVAAEPCPSAAIANTSSKYGFILVFLLSAKAKCFLNSL